MLYPLRILLVAVVAYLSVRVVDSVKTRATVLGVFRKPSNTQHEGGMVRIPDTMHCEDLHHHLKSGKLFTACEGAPSNRHRWFPPMGIVEDFKHAKQGSLHVIDPVVRMFISNVINNASSNSYQEMTSTKLSFENFDLPLVTHGIDVITDPDSEDAVYIFAVNHLPNPEYQNTQAQSLPKARSQIELFHHVLGTTSAKHVRSMLHPAVYTPNDILAMSPTTFYVTNDHYYRDGFLRQVGEILPIAAWSNTVFVQIHDFEVEDPTQSIEVSEAISGVPNNNGLGRGVSHTNGSEEVLVGSAAFGILYRMLPSPSVNDNSLVLVEEIQVDSAIDNPSFFQDPHASADDDASGYVLAGLSRAADLAKNARNADAADPVVVWYLRKNTQGSWEKRLLFEDDGRQIRTSSTAVIVAIDPALESGKKKGWLFVAGFFSSDIIAVKVDL